MRLPFKIYKEERNSTKSKGGNTFAFGAISTNKHFKVKLYQFLFSVHSNAHRIVSLNLHGYQK